MPASASDTIALTVPVAVGQAVDEVAIEAGHLERLFRIAAFVAVRDGFLAAADGSRAPGGLAAPRLLPGPVRARHGEVHCLQSCRVELRRTHGAPVLQVEFGREAFGPFALARAACRFAPAAVERAVFYALHGVPSREDAVPVVVPPLPVMSVDALARRALRWGAPTAGWIVSVMMPAVARGLAELELASRASGVETAGRIHTRIGFDPSCRTFVRVLETLVVARDAPATAVAVRSTAASWGEFLASRPPRPSVASSAHTHVHLRGGVAAEPTDPVRIAPCISVDDLVTHYVNFPDPLSAALIVSVFADTAEVRIYGYTPGAVLHEEAGWWLFPEEDHA
jgi:hypothetical protein